MGCTSLVLSSIRCVMTSPMASHGEAPGFISFTTVDVADCLTIPKTAGSWKGDLEERTSFKWVIISCASYKPAKKGVRETIRKKKERTTITHRNTKVNKFGHEVIQCLHLRDDMWLDRRRILCEVFQPLDHFPGDKRVRMPNLPTRCKELTSRASWHSCISLIKHQVGRTRLHQCCNHPYQSQHLKKYKLNLIPSRFVLKQKTNLLP
jgi:hypothetical protein